MLEPYDYVRISIGWGELLFLLYVATANISKFNQLVWKLKVFSLFLAGSVIKCFGIPPNSKLKKNCEKSFALRRLAHKFAAVSKNTTWARVSGKFILLFP